MRDKYTTRYKYACIVLVFGYMFFTHHVITRMINPLEHTLSTLARSHAVMWDRLDKIEADFYGMCGQCHDGVTGATREEQEEMLHKILRGEL